MNNRVQQRFDRSIAQDAQAAKADAGADDVVRASGVEPEAGMTETILRRRLMEFGVPLHAHDGLVLYLMHGLRPGHFLMAVLENDLLEAVSRADDENVVALHRYVKFLFNVAPSVAWGSPGEVAEWITSHRKAREVEVQQEGA